MKILLDSEELAFLDITKIHLSDYTKNDLVMDWLMKCTKQQITKKNFIEEFDKFLKCIQNKMVKMVSQSEFSYNEGKTIFSSQDNPIKVPSFIEPEKITRSIMSGYKYLKPKAKAYATKEGINLENYDESTSLYFTLVLIIIARANLEHRFSK